MKKTVILILCLALLFGCSNQKVEDETTQSEQETHVTIDTPTGDFIEIKEKLFIAQTNDIYFNTDDYLGKTIKYEGIFDEYRDSVTNITYYSVIRYGPGCCGYDSNAGFEVIWDKGYPEANEWVEVVGVLERYEELDEEYLRLKIISLTVLDTRGQEYVAQ